MFSKSEESNYELDNAKLYHYTSASALRKILREEGIVLRFTKYGFVNDKSEGKVIMELFQKACDTLLEEKLISQHFYDEIIHTKKSGEKNFFVVNNEAGSSLGKVVKTNLMHISVVFLHFLTHCLCGIIILRMMREQGII